MFSAGSFDVLFVGIEMTSLSSYLTPLQEAFASAIGLSYDQVKLAQFSEIDGNVVLGFEYETSSLGGSVDNEAVYDSFVSSMETIASVDHQESNQQLGKDIFYTRKFL